MNSNVSEKDAVKVADAYVKFAIAGDEGYHDGPARSEQIIQKFYENYKVDRELSTRENTIFFNDRSKQVISNQTGTKTPLEAYKNWGEAMSREQSYASDFAIGGISAIFPEIAGIVSANKTKIDELVNMTSAKTNQQRLDEGQSNIDKINKKYTDYNKLLTGYSLGGYITRQLASNNNMNAMIFNPAVGKTSVADNVKNKIIEFRMSGDLVSQRIFEPEATKTFTFANKQREPEPRTGFRKTFEDFFTDTDRVNLPPAPTKLDPLYNHQLSNFLIDKNDFFKKLDSPAKYMALPLRTAREKEMYQPLNKINILFDTELFKKKKSKKKLI